MLRAAAVLAVAVTAGAVLLAGCGEEEFDRNVVVDRVRVAATARPDDGGLALDEPLAICVIDVLEAVPDEDLERFADRLKMRPDASNVFTSGLADCLASAGISDPEALDEAWPLLGGLVFVVIVEDEPNRDDVVRLGQLIPESNRP